MVQLNISDAETQLSKLVERVKHGEQVVITLDGVPVAELVPARPGRLVLGAGRHDPNVNHEVLRSDVWWKPFTDEEADAFIDGR